MKYDFSTMHERVMDIVFLETIGTDPDFAKLFISKTKWNGSPFQIEKIELSKTDPQLGESDITAIININNEKIALLIEDKIDAPAMPEQHKRYIEQAEKGIKNGEFSDYAVFIVCPEKYYKSNSEAGQYEHCLLYEECLDYFSSKNSTLDNIRSEQLKAAIIRAKKPYEPDKNEAAYSYFRQYKDFQQTNLPDLDMRTKNSSNGWWPHYGTVFGNVFIYHKMEWGFVDLTFPNSARHIETMQKIAAWLRHNGNKDIFAEQTAKSVALRIEVPKLNIREDFALTPKDDLSACFEAISRLTEIASIFNAAEKMSRLKKV